MRYLIVFKYYFLVNLKSILIYDVDYILGIAALLLKNTLKFCILLIIFHLIKTLDGWNFNQILFLYGFSLTTYALWHCFFINTISIPTMIQTGTFDRFLLRPISPIFQIMCDGFDEDGWGDLLLGIIILSVAALRLSMSGIYLLLLPVLLFAASLIYAGISLLLSCIAFFTVGNSDFTDVTGYLAEFAKYPLPIYGRGLQCFFTYIIPVGFAAYYPSLFFIKGCANGLATLIVSPFVAVFFFLASCSIWNMCLRYYSSTGH